MKVLLVLFSLLLLASHSMAQATPTVTFSKPAGYYPFDVLVGLSSNTDGIIYYTTNGTIPSASANRYSQPIKVDTTTVIRAILMNNTTNSKVFTNTYIVRRDSTHLPILSVSISPDALFNPGSGLFTKGYRAGSKFPFKGANYYSRKEVPCYIELFDENKQKVFESDIGFKIFGGMSRIFPQKSFSLYASKTRYGTKYIKYPIFKDKTQKKYKRLVLRNSGSDFGETHFRDALITSFGREIGLETQAYQPAAVYINGQYWGMYNFREKLTRHYIVENFGLDKDSIDLIEHHKSVQAGSRKHYDAMRQFMRTNNLSDQKNFDYVSTLMDVENFMEYQILQIYIDNQDAGGNIKFWRPKTEGGKWRWILFDTDFGLGHYGRDGFKNNSLEFHTKPDGPSWPNPPWSTLNLRSLLQNKGFQEQFVSRFLDRMNYNLDSTRLDERIDQFSSYIKPEMERHWQRWNLPEHRWHREIKRMKEFGRKRPEFVRKHLKAKFPWVGQEARLTTQIDSGGGTVMVNEVIPVQQHFTGIYFRNIPVLLEAKPYFGYQFSHWLVNNQKQESRFLKLNLASENTVVKAVFRKGEHPAAQQMIINEVSFYDTLAGDWIEFYNATDEPLDVTDWTIVDKKGNVFHFPSSATIGAKNYIVVCTDAQRFQKAFPTSKNYIAGLTFGLDNHKEKIMLYDATGLPVDSIGYKIDKDQAKEIKTLVLRDFTADNTDKANWELATQSGSPASVNPEYVQIKEKADWDLFLYRVKIGGIVTASFVLIVGIYITVRKKMGRGE